MSRRRPLSVDELAEARERLEYDVSRWGTEHPFTLASMERLATVLRDLGELTEVHLGELTEVRALLENVLGIRPGAEDPGTLALTDNLAMVLRDLGELIGARALLENVLGIRRRVLGARHPDTWVSMEHLVMVRLDLGERGEALELLDELLSQVSHMPERVLEVRREMWGTEHPKTLASMDYLVSLRRTCGELTEARELGEEVVGVRRRVSGAAHPDTLASMNDLAMLMRDLGKLAEVREIQKVRWQPAFGEHPAMHTRTDDLAMALRDPDDLVKARELLEEVVGVRQRVLGAGHPDTLASMNNLAMVVWDLDGLAEARELHAQGFDVLREHIDLPFHAIPSRRVRPDPAMGPGGGIAVLDIVQWVAIAIGSGVAGNISYDTLKHMLRRRKQPTGPEVQSDNSLLIARFAVMTRCAQLGLHDALPAKITSIRLRSVNTDEAGSKEYHLVSDHLEARVVIPSGNLNGHEIAVTLYRTAE